MQVHYSGRSLTTTHTHVSTSRALAPLYSYGRRLCLSKASATAVSALLLAHSSVVDPREPRYCVVLLYPNVGVLGCLDCRGVAQRTRDVTVLASVTSAGSSESVLLVRRACIVRRG